MQRKKEKIYRKFHSLACFNLTGKLIKESVRHECFQLAFSD